MHIINFLKSGKTPDDLKNMYGINHRVHTKYPQLVLFKYDQIDSHKHMHEPIVQECRGVIIDTNTMMCVSKSFSKFFNYGELNAANIDWNTAKINEKLDGSLCVLYWYDNKWHVQTSGVPDASSNIDDLQITFSDLFWKTHNDMGYKLPSQNFDTDICLSFELMTPFNKVVVRHAEPKLVLIGAHNRLTGIEYVPEELKLKYSLPYDVVRSFPLNTIDEIVTSFDSINPYEQEGYVVVDNQFRRIKLKHPGYVRAHHLRGEGKPTYKRMIAIIKASESDELLAAFPEYRELHNKVAVAMAELEDDLRVYLNEANEHVLDTSKLAQLTQQREQKEFASVAVKSPWPDILFRLRSGKLSSIKDGIYNAPDDQILSVIKQYIRD